MGTRGDAFHRLFQVLFAALLLASMTPAAADSVLRLGYSDTPCNCEISHSGQCDMRSRQIEKTLARNIRQLIGIGGKD